MSPAGGLQRRKTPASSISPWNLPRRAAPIRARSAAHRATCSRRTPGSAWQVGRLAIQRILEGYGYELTGMDVIDAYNHFMAAAQILGMASQARADVLAMATKQPGATASDILIRQCSVDSTGNMRQPRRAITTERRTWTRRSSTRH